MGIEFKIEPGKRIVHTTFKGDLDIDDVIDALAAIISHEDFEPGMNGIFDLVSSKWESDPEDLRKIVRFMIENSDRIGLSRCAVVVGSERSYGMSRMLEVFSEESSIDVRVFRDFDEAGRWIVEEDREGN